MATSSKMNQIQGLRAVAFLAIFMSHTGIGNVGFLGPWGVSVFIIMSGFLMMLSYLKKDAEPRFGFKFAWHKTEKLYPLHLFTTVFSALYAVHVGHGLVGTLRDMGIHALMIQMWIPKAKYYTTLNGPAWYLCASFFLYLCFPLILKLFKKRMNKQRAIGFMALTVLLQILVGLVTYYWGPRNGNAWFCVQWATYYFPPTRLLDFALGCALGYLFANRKQQPSRKWVVAVSVVAEIAVCLLIWLSFIVYNGDLPGGILGSQSFKFSFIFMPTTLALLWLLAAKQGLLSRVLAWKPFVWLGDISPYGFLIHGVAMKYTRLFLTYFNAYNKDLAAVVSFAATILGSLLWMGICKFFKTRYLKTVKA